MDLSAEHWEGVTPAEREALARRLAKQLPSGFTYRDIRHFRLGEWGHHVALYQKDNATFALIPGTVVSIGYDANRSWEPNPDELESWQDSSEEFGFAMSIREYIAQVTLPIRRVELSPILVEICAVELGREPLKFSNPMAREILREHGTLRQVEVSGGDADTRVGMYGEGLFNGERVLYHTHASVVAELARTGFRFPTSDEWEYVCGGGAPTLFRWGDHVPCDRYPAGTGPNGAAWWRQWARTGWKLKPPDDEFATDWDFHLRPNAFGLLMATNPYKAEAVAEIGVTRGGDGGSTICGGAGFFLGWLTLATAYFEEHSCRYDPTDSVCNGYMVGRRVLELR